MKKIFATILSVLLLLSCTCLFSCLSVEESTSESEESNFEESLESSNESIESSNESIESSNESLESSSESITITYIVIFDSQGGTEVDSQEVIAGEKVLQPTQPTNDGYEFNYWYLTDAEVPFDFETIIDTDITLKAKWTEVIKTYTVTLVNNNGLEDTIIENVPEGTKAEVLYSEYLPIKEGYIFSGWFVGEVKVESTDEVNANITLSAGWDAEVYSITYSDVLSVENLNVIEYTIETPTIQLVDLVKDGYIFDGWFKGEDKVEAIEVGSMGNVELVAKWSVSVCFDIDNDGLVDEAHTKKIAYGSTLATEDFPSVLVPDYMNFESWIVKGTNDVVDVNTEISESIILVPVFVDFETVTISEAEQLSSISGVSDKIFALNTDLTVELAGYTITTLSTIFDLGGHTITLNAVNSDMWDTRCFINEITAKGVVRNGKIVCNYTAINMAIFPKAMVIDVNDGLVKDVQIDGNFSGTTNFAMGFLGIVDCDGTYENMVFRASSPESCYFGIFNHYDDYGAMGNIVLKNCVFITNTTSFSAYYPGNTVATLDSVTNKTNCIAVRNYAEFKKANYNVSSFSTDVWTINADANLPLIVDEKLETRLFVNSQEELSAISGIEGETYYLNTDLTIDLVGWAITTLSSTLDLNGHTITLNAVNSDMWDTRCFINEITAKGVVRNGKIVCNYTAINMAIFPKAMVIDINDGLVKDVQIDGNFSGGTNFAMGFLGIVDCDGTYENMVFRASSPASCYFGIFNHYDDFGAMGNIVLKNCIFITNTTSFSAYYQGNTVATLDSVTNKTNCIAVRNYAEFKKANYDVSSFSTDIWTINADANLPLIVDEKLETRLFVNSQEELSAISGIEGETYYLNQDLTIDLAGYTITTLSSTLDLNGHTITLNAVNSDMWDTRCFINEITAKGVVRNGKIVCNYTAINMAIFPKAMVIDINDGLVKDVQIDGNFSGTINFAIGFLGAVDCDGTYENVVFRASSPESCYFGIFNHYDDFGAMGNIVLKNCIFITNTTSFSAYYPGNTVATLDSVTNKTNCIAVRNYAEFKKVNYDVSSFSTDVWTINADANLPLVVDEKLDTRLFVYNQAELSAISGIEGETYYLNQDLTIDLAGWTITTLSSTLDLNGHTITLNAVNSDMWDTRCFINEITAKGVVRNGKIVCNYTAINMAIFPKAMVIDVNDGLVKDVQIDGNFSGGTNFAMGFLGIVDCDGTYENVVFRASSPESCYFGIFNHYDDYGAMGNIVLKNCIFITNTTSFSAYYPGNTVATLDSVTNKTNCIAVATENDFATAGFDTSSFSEEMWTINETTKLPTR